MIARLEGTVAGTAEGKAIIAVGGVGYLVTVPRRFAASLAEGDAVTVPAHLHVAEGVLDLYGFPDEETKGFFQLLISVAGIGPKLALGIVDAAPIAGLAAAIEEGKPDVVVQVPGVGRKLADRIVLELKGKAAGFAGAAHGEQIDADNDIVEALKSLGYRRDETAAALKLVGDEIEGVEERLKAALKYLRKG